MGLWASACSTATSRHARVGSVPSHLVLLPCHLSGLGGCLHGTPSPITKLSCIPLPELAAVSSLSDHFVLCCAAFCIDWRSPSHPGADSLPPDRSGHLPDDDVALPGPVHSGIPVKTTRFSPPCLPCRPVRQRTRRAILTHPSVSGRSPSSPHHRTARSHPDCRSQCLGDIEGRPGPSLVPSVPNTSVL